MKSFRKENWFLIYYVNVFGLYMTSIESLTSNKWLIGFFTVWTKIPVSILPVYISLDIRSLIFDEMSVLSKFAMIRKINRKTNQKENKAILRMSLILAVIAALSYSVPSFFSKKKKISHPSGIIYPHRSPEFEIAVAFDFCVCLSCISAAAFDCILMVFLSHVRSKLSFLRETLSDIINEVIIDTEGKLMGKRTECRDYPGKYLLGHADGSSFSEIQSEEEDFYEERKKKSEQFDRNVANVEAKLKIWILHHQQTISFFEETTKVYSGTASFQLGYIVIYTALTALHVVQMKLNLVALGIALVASSNLLSLFFWCKIGGDLRSIDPFDKAFGQAWFLFPKKIKTSFSFIIMRSKKPLTLYGLSIYGMNLITFFELLKLTYQFFAFMVQITAKEN